MAPCSDVCHESLAVSNILRSLYFDDPERARQLLGDVDCSLCSAPCVSACVLSDKGNPVAIKEILTELQSSREKTDAHTIEDVDLSTDICGVHLENPFIISSSVAASSYDMCARAFEAGWAAVSFKTLCSFEQHEASPRFSAIRNHTNAFIGFKNIEQLSGHTVEEDLEIFRRLKQKYPEKVIIASIMGKDESEWTYLASACEESGADVIECNFSCPNMEQSSLGSTIGQSEELVERFTRAVKRGTKLPVLAKLTPNVADMVPFAIAAKRGGADGIAAINTIYSITGVDIDNLVAEPSVHGKSIIGGYSGPAVKPIALRFISELRNSKDLCGMHISGMGGIETWRDALEFILLGSGSVQMTTSVMQYGYRIIDDLLHGLRSYMQRRGIRKVSELVGAAASSVVDHQSIERDTILYPVIYKDRCNGCLRCYSSCMDGGHQAIEITEGRLPRIDAKKCIGCHLCRLVCPVMAIGQASKPISIR